MSTLFDEIPEPSLPQDLLGPGTAILNGFALDVSDEFALLIQAINRLAPFRYMITPDGFRMSVAMTNCGQYGWVSDRTGYRYDGIDPESGQHWPGMPETFFMLARTAAHAADFEDFCPDACLINRYAPGVQLTLHQDQNERDFSRPIVSVSLGLPATFLIGGIKQSDKVCRIPLHHGDVIVWGGQAQLHYHGISVPKNGAYPMFGGYCYNLTFRCARHIDACD